MPVYIGAFAISIVLALLFCRNGASEKKHRLIWLPVIPILLVSVFRYGVGADYFWVYDYGFESVVEGRSWNYSRFEPGYLAINFLVYYLGGTSFWVFAIISVLYHYFIYRFILDWSDNIPLSLLILFVSQQWLFSLNAIRQALAIAIAAYALKYIVKSMPKYFFLIILAASMHFMALVFLPLYWLLRKHYSQVGVVFCSVILLAISSLFPNVLESIASIVGREGYFDSAYSKDRLYYMEFATTLLVVISTFVLQSKSLEFGNRYQLIINLAVFGLLAASASAAIPNAERFDMFFTVSYIVLIPQMARQCRTQLAALLMTLLLVGTLGARLVYDTYVNGDSNGIAEYSSIILSDIRY